jgi:hypothetical protein
VTTIDEAFEQAEADLSSADEVVALDEGPAESGQAVVEGTDEVVSDEPSYFDLEQYGNQVVKIRVDDEDITVPVSELRNGYMRQAAFTQKTQGLAAERARLQAAETLAAAYERNPIETVRFLAQQQGLSLAEAQAQAEAATEEQAEGWANDGYADPRYAALDQRLQAFEQTQAREELGRELTRLGNLYGDDFDPNEVVAAAIQRGSTDLDGVYKQIAFDRLYARKGAEAELAQRSATETAQRTAAKAALGGTVASGSSFNGAGSAGSAPATTVEEAFAAAEAEHGSWNFD